MWSFYKPPQQTSIVFQRIFLLRSFFLFVCFVFPLCVYVMWEFFFSSFAFGVSVMCEEINLLSNIEMTMRSESHKSQKVRTRRKYIKRKCSLFHKLWSSCSHQLIQSDRSQSSQLVLFSGNGWTKPWRRIKSLRVVCVCVCTRTLCIVYTNLYTRLGTDASQKI